MGRRKKDKSREIELSDKKQYAREKKISIPVNYAIFWTQQ